MNQATSMPLPEGALWAIEEGQGNWLLETLQNPQAVAALLASPKREQDAAYEIQGRIAILRLTGAMTKESSWWHYYLGGVSSLDAIAALKSIADDYDAGKVRGLNIIVDSPGGDVDGTQEFAHAVRDLAAKMPVYAYIEDCCCSAAYWAVCAATKIFANATADIGNIGIIGAITDSSEAVKRAGIKRYYIVTHPNKAAGAPGNEVTDDHLDLAQNRVDAKGAQFFGDVRAGRNLSDAQLAAVTDARIFVGAQAVDVGLVDGICSLDACLSQLEEAVTERGGATRPWNAGQKETHTMRASLAGALSRLGLTTLAAAILGAKSDEADDVTAKLAEQVNVEVEAKVKANPLLVALAAMGIQSVEQLAGKLTLASFGEGQASLVRQDAKSQAIRAYGAELGPKISASVDALPPGDVATLAASWKAEADTKYGVGKDGQAATRVSAPGAKLALAAEGDDAQATKWEKLKPEQQATAVKMFGLKTDADKERYAANFLDPNAPLMIG